MGGCASKTGIVGSERLDGVAGETPSSLTSKPRSSASGITASTGSQLRSPARTAWQTSARSLRMSLNRSRKRQESYRVRSKTSGTSDVEDDEIDSAGCGGQPAQRGHRPLHNGVTPTGKSASSDPAGMTATGGIAWESSAELDTQTSAGRARGRNLIDTAKTAGIEGAVAALAAAAATGAASAANDLLADSSCVQSFHVTGRAVDDLDDSGAEGEDPYDTTGNPSSAAAAVAAAGDQGARQHPQQQHPQQQHPQHPQQHPQQQQQQRRTRGTAGPSTAGCPASTAAGGPSLPNGWDADLASRAPRTSSPAGHDGGGGGGGGGGGRHRRTSIGGGGGWTAPLAPTGAAAAAAAAAAAVASPGAGGAAAGGGGGGCVQVGATAATAAAAGAGAAPADTVQWVIRPGPPIESAYVLGDVLGKGSFGVVHQANHAATGTKVAVKTIRKALLGAAEVSSLRREVEILHHLSGHPHISQLLGVYEEATQLHLVLELYQGGDLFDAIIAVGRHSERAAADVMRTVLTAISYCHAMGVAHRDIKPENFMLTAPTHPALMDQPQRTCVEELTAEDLAAAADCSEQARAAAATRASGGSGGESDGAGEGTVGSRLKLIDFGLSVFCSDATPMTDTVGTSYYVAPEVLGKCYRRSADVWSAGVILHILLTGYAPFDGRNDQEILKAVQTGKLDMSTDPIWTSISRDARMVLLSMLNRDPAARATADQLLAMPWLGRTASACTASSTPLPGVVSERMRRFARMNSFKKEARRVVAGLMRPEEVAGLVAQFRGLDADGDGKLSVRELKEGLTRQELQLQSQGDGAAGVGASMSGGVKPLREEELRQLVERADLNGDGMLDQSEFLGAAVPAAAIASQAQQALAAARSATAVGRPGSRSVAVGAAAAAAGNPLAAAFAHFDADGSGFITPDELKAALAAHHPNGQGPDVRALLSRVDQDADGRISYVEFLEMMVQEVDENDEVYDGYESFGSGAGGGGSLAVPKPGVIRRDGGGGHGRLAQPAVQRLRGTHAVGSSIEKAQQRQQPQQLAYGRAGGGCRVNGKHHQQQPHQRRQHAAQHDDDMVPYEQLPTDTRVGGGRGLAAGAGFVGGPGGAAGRQRAAAWGGGHPTTVAASSSAAAVRARREAAAAATVMPAPRGDTTTTTSRHVTAAVRSYSGGVQSLDWCDECRTESGEGDVGGDVGWERDDAGPVGAADRQHDTAQYGGGRGVAAVRAAGGYVPSRLSPLGPMGGGAAGATGRGQGGFAKAAEAAALTLMSQGKDPNSLLQQITDSGAAPSAAYRGAAPSNGFLANSTAQCPPPLVIPQPVGARRARRHSAAEVLDDSLYAGYGVDVDTAADGGRFGLPTDRLMREARMSEGNANALSRGSPKPLGGGGGGLGGGGGGGGGNLGFHSGPNALRLAVANPQQWQPANDRSRRRQVQALPVEPFASAAADRPLSSGSGSGCGSSPSTATAASGRPAGNNFCLPRVSAVPLRMDLSPASTTAAQQRQRISGGGGAQPSPVKYLVPPSGDSRSGRLSLTVPQTASWTPNRIAPAPDGCTARCSQPYSGGGLGGFGAGERRPGAVSSPYDADDGYAVQNLTLLPPGMCGDDADGATARAARAMPGSQVGSRRGPAPPTAVGDGFASEPLPSLSLAAQRGQRATGSSWSGDGVGDGGGGGSVRQRGGGSNNTTGVHEHMVLQNKLPSWDEESVEFA